MLADAAPMAPPPAYRLVWSEEFSRRGRPDERRWTYDTERNRRGWHNEELQYYSARRSANARVRGGRLIIEARAERLGRRRYPDWGGQAYTSARLTTRGKASWNGGFVEVRAKLPCARGTWPAVWMLPDTRGIAGEIDLMEHVGFDPGVVHQTVHIGSHARTAASSRPSACLAWHSYQLHWTATTLRLGVDGVETLRVERKGSASPFDAPYHLILNLAVGGSWGGRAGVDSAAFPARLEIDHVRVWAAR